MRRRINSHLIATSDENTFKLRFAKRNRSNAEYKIIVFGKQIIVSEYEYKKFYSL